MNLFIKSLLLNFLITCLLIGQEKAITQLDPTPLNKIKFDLSAISEQGLIGHPDGLRSVTYEFCIPKRQAMINEVMSINSNIEMFYHSRGRINCQSDEVLVLGNTHHPQWKETLINLAQLDYIKSIQEYYGE